MLLDKLLKTCLRAEERRERKGRVEKVSSRVRRELAKEEVGEEEGRRKSHLSELEPSLEAFDRVEIPLLPTSSNSRNVVLSLVDDELSSFDLFEDLFEESRTKPDKMVKVSE